MKNYFLLHIIWLLAFSFTRAQAQPVVFHGNPLTRQVIDIGAYTYFYEDKSADTLPLSSIRQQTFRSFDAKRNDRASFSDRSLLVTWLRFSVRNTHPSDTVKLFYHPGVAALIDIYQHNRYIGKAGNTIIISPDQPHRFFYPISVPPKEEHTYWVRTTNFFNAPTPIMSQLYTLGASHDFLVREIFSATLLLLAMGIMAGCLLFMCLYATYHYWLNRDRSFLYYMLYVSLCFILAVNVIDARFGLALLYPYLPAIGLPLSPMLVFACYVLFIREMLQVNMQQRVLSKVLNGLLIVLLLQQVIPTIEFFLRKPLFAANSYYMYQLLPTGFTLILVLWLIIRSSSPVKKYLLTGSLSLVILSLLPLTTNFYIQHLPYRLDIFVNFIAFWAFLGLTIECFCFALALAYRSRLVELEKNQLQQSYTRQLEEEIHVRTREIEVKNLELEAQHIRQLETAFEQKLAETETTALRAQMNPHFIFNCLNSIKFFVLENDGKAAADYLTKFSKLIRLVLENSRAEKVLLANELEALDLYLQMEVMRFNHKLHYQIIVADEIDVSFTEIPPLLIQPYVENAIWHGLMHKPDGGKVTVKLNQPSADSLLVTITDNGIGRAKAAQLKSKSATRHKSFGMKMTSERIHLINQLYQSKTQVQVLDLVDTVGEACGTEVIISIPV